MGADRLIQLCTWVDVVYGVQPFIKIHTNIGMSYGYGMVHFKSSKQKLNTKSSTASKVVGVRDYLLYNIWICLFMGAQVYDINQNILFQDNQTAIKMEENWKKSFNGNYRHINIIYFFVKDRIKMNNIPISYRSTDHMLAYFFTEALQGALFVNSFEVIMIQKLVSPIQMGPPSTKEHVGNVVEVE